MSNVPPTIDVQDSQPPLKKADDFPVQAVALQYERGMDEAPRVVATGQGYVAEQILAIAHAQGVKVRKDADLIEILSTLDVDSVIPVEAFATVAEILNYVYAANASAAQRALQTMHKE